MRVSWSVLGRVAQSHEHLSVRLLHPPGSPEANAACLERLGEGQLARRLLPHDDRDETGVAQRQGIEVTTASRLRPGKPGGLGGAAGATRCVNPVISSSDAAPLQRVPIAFRRAGRTLASTGSRARFLGLCTSLDPARREKKSVRSRPHLYGDPPWPPQCRRTSVVGDSP